MRAVVTTAALATAAIAVCALTGCARPGDKVTADIQTVQAEETPQKLLARGRAFASVGDHGRAEQYFAAALDRGAEPRVALPLLLRACAEEKRYRAAIDYAEPVLRRHPGDYRLRFVVASFYSTVGETAAAREELLRVAKDKPDFAPVHFALGVLMRDEAGDVVSADAHFREYLRLEPRGAHADEARSSLLKMVDHGGGSVTTPPALQGLQGLHDPPRDEPARKKP